MICLRSITCHIWRPEISLRSRDSSLQQSHKPVGGYLNLELWRFLLSIDYWSVTRRCLTCSAGRHFSGFLGPYIFIELNPYNWSVWDYLMSLRPCTPNSKHSSSNSSVVYLERHQRSILDFEGRRSMYPLLSEGFKERCFVY